jgi:hypothetical protein
LPFASERLWSESTTGSLAQRPAASAANPPNGSGVLSSAFLENGREDEKASAGNRTVA